jgi:hypothetical protein
MNLMQVETTLAIEFALEISPFTLLHSIDVHTL